MSFKLANESLDQHFTMFRDESWEQEVDELWEERHRQDGITATNNSESMDQ